MPTAMNHTPDQDGHVVRMSFDQDNRAVLVTDANGMQTWFSYTVRVTRNRRAIGVPGAFDANGQRGDCGAQAPQVTTYALLLNFNQVVAPPRGVGNALTAAEQCVVICFAVTSNFGGSSTHRTRQARAQLTAADSRALTRAIHRNYTYDPRLQLLITHRSLGRVTSFTYETEPRHQSTDPLQSKPSSLRRQRHQLPRQTSPVASIRAASYDGLKSSDRFQSTVLPVIVDAPNL